MSNFKKLALTVILMGLSYSVMAQIQKVPNPPAQSIPTLTANPLQASPSEPVLIDGIQATGSSSFLVVYMDTSKIVGTVAQQTALINYRLGILNPSAKISACLVGADINATGINCGNGLVQFNTYDYYTFTRPFNLQKLPIVYPRGVKEVFGADFKSPVGTIPGDSQGRVVHLHFSTPISQFLIHVDSGQPVAPSVSGIQFVVSNGTLKVSKPLTQTLTAPTQFVGIQRASGFTDVEITPLGGQSQAFAADLYTVVPKIKFVP